jgi:uncharacterized membrane protein
VSEALTPAESPPSAGREGTAKDQRIPVLRRPRFLEWAALLTMLGAFAIVVTYLCDLRAENFFTTNWDLGINQQMLWTTTHGSLLYEAGDFESYGVSSFLQVHSTYLALLIAPIYSAAPIPLTLIAIQATVFAASSVPLYLIGRSVVRRRLLLFLGILVYLTNFVILSGLFYDFHWEAFIPLEFFSFFLLVHRRRFLLSLAPLFAGMLTLEVFPFLAGGIILFFFVERLGGRSWTWKKILADQDVRILAGLLALAGLSYVLLRFLEYVVIPGLLGVPSSTAGSSGALTSIFTFTANSGSLGHSALYWMLILACLGFLPILSPKHLILALPWFAESVFFFPAFSSHFGNQYGLLAVSSVAIAFFYGLGNLESSSHGFPLRTALALALFADLVTLTVFAASTNGSRVLLSGTVGALVWAAVLCGPVVAVGWTWVSRRIPQGQGPVVERPGLRRLRRVHAPLLVATFAVLLVFNGVMSPVNTNNFDATPLPGYAFQWGQNPVAAQMGWVTSYVPSGAVILASDNLFPYVANNPNAYSVPWFVIGPSSPLPYFPFTATDLPDFVLVDVSQFSLLPPFLQQDLFNSTTYGLVVYVYTTEFPGTVYLFEEGYALPPLGREMMTPPATYFFSSANLTLGPVGRVGTSPIGKFGTTIASTPGYPFTGNNCIWYGPYVTLLPGAYHVVFNLTGVALNGSKPLLDLRTGPYLAGYSLGGLVSSVVYPGQLSPNRWTNLQYNITFSVLYPYLEFRGYLEFTKGIPNGSITLNYIEVTRA